MLYFITIAVGLTLALVFYLVDRTKPRQHCPSCNSSQVRQLSKEPVQVQDRPNQSKHGVVIGSFRAHVRYELKFLCENCQTKWQYETSAPPADKARHLD